MRACGETGTACGASLRGSLASVAVAVSLTIGALGCGPAARPRPTEAPRPIGTLHAPAHYPVDFAIDQQVTAEHAGGSESFRAIVEKRGDRLVMIGLGPHGGRAFVLTQEGDHVAFESQLPRELPFPPEFMLMDVHRTWLMGVPREGQAPLPDGRHEAVVDGETIVEEWEGGRLQRRSYTIPTSNLAYWSVHITYEGGLDPRVSEPGPARVVLEATPAPDQRYRLVLDAITRSP
ncbi:MAG: hypothetical protein OHK0013_33490 [Sandaracinaceae bacterium]